MFGVQSVGCCSLLIVVVCCVVCVRVRCWLFVVWCLFDACCSLPLMVVLCRGMSLCEVRCALLCIVCCCLLFVV